MRRHYTVCKPCRRDTIMCLYSSVRNIAHKHYMMNVRLRGYHYANKYANDKCRKLV